CPLVGVTPLQHPNSALGISILWPHYRRILHPKPNGSFISIWPVLPLNLSCLTSNRNFKNCTTNPARNHFWRERNLLLSGECPICWGHRQNLNKGGNPEPGSRIIYPMSLPWPMRLVS